MSSYFQFVQLKEFGVFQFWWKLELESDKWKKFLLKSGSSVWFCVHVHLFKFGWKCYWCHTISTKLIVDPADDDINMFYPWY